MATVAGLQSNLGLPYPVRGLPFGVVFPILDADGDFVTGAAGLDSEVSKDGDTFADCTNEATEIATSSGVYYLLLTATEMTAQTVAVQVKTTTTGAKTTPIVLYTRAPMTVRTATAAGGAAGYITLDGSALAVDNLYNGLICYISSGTGSGQTRIVTGYTGSSKQAAVTPNWTTNPDNTSVFYLYSCQDALYPNANLTHMGGSALSTSSAQVGVNVVNMGGSALSTSTAQVGVNLVNVAGSAVDANSAQLGTNVVSVGATAGNTIADAILKRDWSSVSGESARSVLNALRFLRNKWAINGTTLTVKKEDDSTTAWTSTVTTAAGADPVTGNTP